MNTGEKMNESLERKHTPLLLIRASCITQVIWRDLTRNAIQKALKTERRHKTVIF